MKIWRRITIVSFLILFFIVIYVNWELLDLKDERIPQAKLTEINRMYEKMKQGVQTDSLETNDIQIHEIASKELNLFLYMNHAKEHMVVLPSNIDGNYYVFMYTVTRIPMQTIWKLNPFFLIIFLFLGAVILYVYLQILRPFHRFEHIAQAMRNRNFAYELPKQRNQYFGKFIWAVDVMREELRQHEEKEMRLLKENKLMIAAISHDIKTPLSTIRLYSDALEKNFYSSTMIQQRINESCDKIDAFVKEIQQTNREHLFDFDVVLQDVYIHEIEQLLASEKERIILHKIQDKQTLFIMLF